MVIGDLKSHVFLFFDVKDVRELKVKEELKKKLSRQDREVRRFAAAKDIPGLLKALYGMADFYSAKVAPEAKNSDDQRSLRLEFLLWKEVQYQSYQLSKSFQDPGLSLVVKNASLALIDIAKRILSVHGIAFEITTVRELGNDGTERDFEAISMLPGDTSLPGKLARKLLEEGFSHTLLCYSPYFTGAQGWAGKLTEKALYVSCDFILESRIDPDTGHELCHWQSAKALLEGRLTPFHGDVLRGEKRPLPESVGPYEGGLEFDELEAYGYNMLVGEGRLKRARGERHLLSELLWLRLEAETGANTAKAIAEITADALSTLDVLSKTSVMERINFTSNRRSNSDSRDAFWCTIGPDLDRHFGFQLTDFRKPGTDYVRAMVCSKGWILGVPLLGKDIFKKAERARDWHQHKAQKPGLWLTQRFFRDPNEEGWAFFLLVKSALIERLTAQHELALKMEKDFSHVRDRVSVLLTEKTDAAREDLTRALSKFSEYPIGRSDAA